MATPATSVGVNDISPCLYAIVQQVQINEVGADSVTYSTRSNQNTLEQYSTASTNVLWHGPAQAPVAVPKQPNKVGNLYLNEAGWAGAKAGGGMYGWDAANPTTGTILFKWPRCFPFLPVEALDLVPTSIHIVDGHGKSHDLFDTKLFSPAQRIMWNAAQPIALAAADGKAATSIWPVKIIVKGKPKTDGDKAGEVDILDKRLADFNQTIEWSKPGSVISPVLRPAGFGEFAAVMDSVRAVAEGRHVYAAEETVKAWDDATVEKLSDGNKKLVKTAREKLPKRRA